MFLRRNQGRVERSSNSAFYKLDPYDLPESIQKYRARTLQQIREADRLGELNELYHPDEIKLENDEEDLDVGQMNTCAGILWMATRRAVRSFRDLVSRNPTTISPGDFENSECVPHLSNYKFNLGPRAIHFDSLVKAGSSGPCSGTLLTYKILTRDGIGLDILEVDIPDSSVLTNEFERGRDVQAKILSERCASLIWIFEGKTQIILVTESSNPFSWTPQQWFRKILSDMALADSIMIGHPYYWHPVVRRRLSRALRHFKKLYKTISEQSKVPRIQGPYDDYDVDDAVNHHRRPLHKVNPKQVRADVYKYKSAGGVDCVKAMEFYPHTRTKLLIGNYSEELAVSQPKAEVAQVLFDSWEQYMISLRKGKAFQPLQKLVEEEVKGTEVLTPKKKKKKIAKFIAEIGEATGARLDPAQCENFEFSPVGPDSDSSLIRVGFAKTYETTAGPRIPLRESEEVIDLAAAQRGQEIDESGIRVIKPATVIDAHLISKHWKDSVYSKSESSAVSIFNGTKPVKARSKRQNSKRHQTQLPSRSEGFIPTAQSRQRNSRSPRRFEPGPHPEQADPPGTSSLIASVQSERLFLDGNKRRGDTANDNLENDRENVLKLGPSKTRYHFEQGGNSATGPLEPEIGPPEPTFNEPYAMQGNVFGFGMEQHEYDVEIPPADADSLSALSPHGLNSREGLPCVVNQLGLETPAIVPTHGHHSNVQQHRYGGGGQRNAANHHHGAAYHAVTQNKSLESLDLGQPLDPRPRKGKGCGNRCSQCHLAEGGHPHQS